MTETAHPRFDYLRQVVNGLRYSQGFYSRLAGQLDTLTDEDMQRIEQELPEFKEPLDVIIFLEE